MALRSATAFRSLILGTLGLVVWPFTAAAVMRGEPARDPNGTRRSTVLIETPEGVCTGTAVGPDLILTAAHCVSSRGRYRVRYLDRAFKRVTAPVIRAAAHPDFDPSHGFATDDIGLIQIGRPFTGDMRPATLPRGGAWSTDWFQTAASAPSEELLIAGFGSTERSQARDGVLREALMRTAEPTVRGRGFAGLSGNEQAQRTGMCVGDSGGPVYRRIRGTFTIVGVLKGGTTDPGRECTSNPVYIPIADYAAWVRRVAADWGTSVSGASGVIEMRQ